MKNEGMRSITGVPTDVKSEGSPLTKKGNYD